jgi:hypothetical protein
MPKTTTGTLSRRLRLAQGRRPLDIVDTREESFTQLAEPSEWHGEGSQCGSSVMAGQRCNRSAVVGDTLCRNHLAMNGTPAARPTSRL